MFIPYHAISGYLFLAIAVSATAVGAQKAAYGQEEFTRWARRNELSFPVDDRGDINQKGADWIERLTRNARVLGIGESAHDVHEFLTLRTLVTQRLIEDGRVAAIVMETSFADAASIDAWLAGRVSDRPDLGHALSFGFGQEAEIAHSLQWIREYNARHRSSQVHFYGADLPADGGGSLQPALNPVWSYLAIVDPEYAHTAKARIEPIARQLDVRGYEIVDRYSHLSPASRDSLRRALDNVASRMAARHASYVARSSSAQFAWAQRLVEIARQTEEAVHVGWNDTTNPRDRAMAANIKWIAAREKGRGLVVVWAHNLHIARSQIGGPIFAERGPPVKSMGQYLQRDFGERYVAIGTAFGTGGPDTTASPNSSSVDAALSEVHNPRFGIVLKTAPSTGPVSAWLDGAHLMRAEDGYVTVRVREAYDALLFVDSVRVAEHLSPSGGLTPH